MLGHHSLSLPLITYDLDFECTLRQTRAKRNSNLLGERHTETMGDGNLVALRDHYLPTMYTSPHVSGCRTLRQPTMRLSLALYKVYHIFQGLALKNPYDFYH
jgi:hypothetical protein